MKLGSIIVPTYTSGEYFSDAQRHQEDAYYKADCFLKLYEKLATKHQLKVNSYVDVGCGCGVAVKTIYDGLTAMGQSLHQVIGYDISPHVNNLSDENVEYIHGDFCQSNQQVDLVTLFDVFEHVPDPISFIKQVSEKTDIIGFHIPLENSWNLGLRNLYLPRLNDPGHLIFLDTPEALTLLSLAGLKVISYDYTFGFLMNVSEKSLVNKLAYLPRLLLTKISPWLLSKTLGGASLIVIALTPKGLSRFQV